MSEIDSETSRILAVLVNSGKFNFAEADQKLAGSRISITLSEEAAQTRAGQAAFLTAVVTGVKSFGQVYISGELNCPLMFPLPIPARTLAEAGAAWGAIAKDGSPEGWSILIGPKSEPGPEWSVQALWDGWVAGIAPGNSIVALGRGDCALAGVGAGALAVGQAFLAETGDIRAGKTFQRLSMWEPENGDAGEFGPGPRMTSLCLPTDLWLVGLGNLGQAYLWSLSLLPYQLHAEVRLFLQDDDRIKRENWGTSVLVRERKYGILKTSLAEAWAIGLGFQVRRIDRKLDADLRVTEDEPNIALAGLDSLTARGILSGRGFKYIVDAGLGATFDEYRKFHINVFSGHTDPAQHFHGLADRMAQVAEQNMRLPAYQALACGAAILAGASAAVPFVGTFAGALAIAQTVRIASGKAHHTTIAGEAGDLRNTRGTLGTAPMRTIVKNSPTAP